MNIMSIKSGRFTETGLPWHIVEEAINREIEWLESHCFTTCMAGEGVNPVPLQVLFGHESLEGVIRYVHAPL